MAKIKSICKEFLNEHWNKNTSKLSWHEVHSSYQSNYSHESVTNPLVRRGRRGDTGVHLVHELRTRNDGTFPNWWELPLWHGGTSQLRDESTVSILHSRTLIFRLELWFSSSLIRLSFSSGRRLSWRDRKNRALSIQQGTAEEWATSSIADTSSHNCIPDSVVISVDSVTTASLAVRSKRVCIFYSW